MKNRQLTKDRNEIFSPDGSICLSSFSAAATPPPKKRVRTAGPCVIERTRRPAPYLSG